MASAMENMANNCHLRGDICRARSETDMKTTVMVDMRMDAQGTNFPLVIIHCVIIGYFPNRRTDSATMSNCPVRIAYTLAIKVFRLSLVKNESISSFVFCLSWVFISSVTSVTVTSLRDFCCCCCDCWKDVGCCCFCCCCLLEEAADQNVRVPGRFDG